MSRSEDSPAWFTPWARSGFLRKETAQQWRDLGFNAEEAGPWYHLDVASPSVAAKWVSSGLGPGDFVRWCSVGQNSPELVNKWRSKRISFEVARRWLVIGVNEPEVVLRCQKMEISSEVWTLCRERSTRKRCEEWLVFSESADWLDRRTRSPWMSNGVDPIEAHSWIYLGVKFEQSQRLKEIGFDGRQLIAFGETNSVPEVARLALMSSSVEQFQYVIENFDDADREPALASGIDQKRFLEWAEIKSISLGEIVELEKLNISPSDFHCWQMSVNSSVDSLILLLKDGISLADAIFWISAGLNHNQISILRHRITMKSFNFLRDCGYSIEVIQGIAGRENSNAEIEYFSEFECSKETQSEMVSLGIPLEEIPGWWFMAQGKTDFVKPWRDQKIVLTDIDEAAKRFKQRIELSDVEKWKANGYSIRQALNLIRDGKNPYFKTPEIRTHSTRSASVSGLLNRPSPSRPLDGWISQNVYRATEEWYESIFSLALFLKSEVRKELSYDHEFENIDSDFSLKISLSRDKVRVLLKDSSGDEESFVFDPSNIYLLSNLNTSRQRLVVGLGLSWFLDWSVVCDGSNGNFGSANFPLRRATGPSKFRSKSKYRYVGVSRRNWRNPSKPNSANASPIFHQVAGFVRRLPDGQSPSLEARNNAPGYIRKLLKSNETWVRPHARGSEIGVLIERLRQSSILAIALDSL